MSCLIVYMCEASMTPDLREISIQEIELISSMAFGAEGGHPPEKKGRKTIFSEVEKIKLHK